MQLEVRIQKAVLSLLLHGSFQAFLRALERSAVGGVDGRRGDIASKAKAEVYKREKWRASQESTKVNFEVVSTCS